MRLLKQSTMANIMVLLVSSTDHVTGVTGATLTITASKDGAAFASISPTVTERGNGWYNIALTTAHTDTLGDLALHISATNADPADLLCSVVAGALDATVSSRATQTSVDAVSGFVDTEVAAIKAKTDNLPASFPSNFPNLLINSSGHLSRVTLVDTTTTNTDMINAATIAASVWVKVAEGSYTVLDLLKIISAVSAGKLSGEPGSPVFRNITDTKNRVTGTVDGSGNRTAVTYDVT